MMVVTIAFFQTFVFTGAIKLMFLIMVGKSDINETSLLVVVPNHIYVVRYDYFLRLLTPASMNF